MWKEWTDAKSMGCGFHGSDGQSGTAFVLECECTYHTKKKRKEEVVYPSLVLSDCGCYCQFIKAKSKP